MLHRRLIKSDRGKCIIKGTSILSGEPLYNAPANIVSSGNFTLTDGVNTAEVTEVLRSVNDVDGVVSARDYIEIENGSVKLYQNIKEDILASNDGWALLSSPVVSGKTWHIYRRYVDVAVKVSIDNAGLCTHLPLRAYMPDILYPQNAPYNCCSVAGFFVYVRVSQDEIGVGEDLASFKAWLNTLQQPIKILYAFKPTVTDITDTVLGQQLLRFRNYSKILSSDELVEIEVLR